MPTRAIRILFLCTGNSARSILAEALLNHHGGGRFVAVSAGTRPSGVVNPLALELLAEAGIDAANLRSENLDRYSGPAAPPIDLAVTLCDSAAAESCPILPGAPATVHWGLADPAAVAGGAEIRREAFARTLAELHARIMLLVSLPEEQLRPEVLEREFGAIHARSS
jgi:arsenate reductase (thioredoxin)